MQEKFSYLQDFDNSKVMLLIINNKLPIVEANILYTKILVFS